MKLLSLLMLLCSASAFAQTDDELPAISASNKNAFFIPAAVCAKYKLEIGQNDDWMKVYNNLADGATIQRINDIRWQAKNKSEAQQWYNNNKKMLSEGADEITSRVSKPAGVDNWNVYGQSQQMQELMKSLGVEQNHFNFTFTVDQYVAKIFIATSSKQTVQDAWQLAKEGLKAILRAEGKSKLADLVL